VKTYAGLEYKKAYLAVVAYYFLNQRRMLNLKKIIQDSVACIWWLSGDYDDMLHLSGIFNILCI
jgi:hypothetical protein